jgi:hypothetical protein
VFAGQPNTTTPQPFCSKSESAAVALSCFDIAARRSLLELVITLECRSTDKTMLAALPCQFGRVAGRGHAALVAMNQLKDLFGH